MARGRKPKTEPDPVIEADALADLLTSLSEDERERVRRALLDRATGHRVFTALRKVNVSPGCEKYEVVPSLAADEVGLGAGWVYSVPPDPGALKLLVDHNQGRAPVRQAEKFDPVIEIRHFVPGKRNWERGVDGAVTCNGAPFIEDQEQEFEDPEVDAEALLGPEPAEPPTGLEDVFSGPGVGEVTGDYRDA